MNLDWDIALQLSGLRLSPYRAVLITRQKENWSVLMLYRAARTMRWTGLSTLRFQLSPHESLHSLEQLSVTRSWTRLALQRMLVYN